MDYIFSRLEYHRARMQLNWHKTDLGNGIVYLIIYPDWTNNKEYGMWLTEGTIMAIEIRDFVTEIF